MAVAFETVATTGWLTINDTLTVTKPTGLAVGDLMIAFLFGRLRNATPTSPTGFSQIVSLDLTGASQVYHLVYVKIATSADVSETDFTWSGLTTFSDQGYGSIFRFSGAGLPTNYSSELNTGTTSATRTFANITVTPATSSSILLALFSGDSIGSSRTVTSFAVANNNPASWTENFDAYESSQDRMIAAAYGAYSETSATGELTVVTSGTHATSDDFGGTLLAIEEPVLASGNFFQFM